MARNRIFLAGLLVASLLVLPACATYQGYQGATAGAAVGGAAGALLSPHNPWRGAVIGGALGAVFGGALGDSAAYNNQGYHRQTGPGYYRGGGGYQYRGGSDYYYQDPPRGRGEYYREYSRHGWRYYDW